MWFKRTKQERIEEAQHTSIEVLEIKSRTHQTANQTKREIDRLNRLLKNNGITLRIHIATHGGRGAK